MEKMLSVLTGLISLAKGARAFNVRCQQCGVPYKKASLGLWTSGRSMKPLGQVGIYVNIYVNQCPACKGRNSNREDSTGDTPEAKTGHPPHNSEG